MAAVNSGQNAFSWPQQGRLTNYSTAQLRNAPDDFDYEWVDPSGELRFRNKTSSYMDLEAFSARPGKNYTIWQVSMLPLLWGC